MDFGTNIVIYDKESQAVLYRGCVADIPFKVCSQKNLLPDVKGEENAIHVTVY